MIKADFRCIDNPRNNKLSGPVIIEGSNIKLLFELNSIIKAFMANNSKEILYAVFANNLEILMKEFGELDEDKFNVCVSVLKKGEVIDTYNISNEGH